MADPFLALHSHKWLRTFHLQSHIFYTLLFSRTNSLKKNHRCNVNHSMVCRTKWCFWSFRLVRTGFLHANKRECWGHLAFISWTKFSVLTLGTDLRRFNHWPHRKIWHRQMFNQWPALHELLSDIDCFWCPSGTVS